MEPKVLKIEDKVMICGWRIQGVVTSIHLKANVYYIRVHDDAPSWGPFYRKEIKSVEHCDICKDRLECLINNGLGLVKVRVRQNT